jgi:hypothetical protein
MCGGCSYKGVTYQQMAVYGLESRLGAVPYNPQSFSYEINNNYVHSFPIPQQQSFSYSISSSYKKEKAVSSENYDSQPTVFLSPDRPWTPFIGAASEISDFIKEAFFKTTGKELSGNIRITVASRAILQSIHPQFSKPGVVGLSINSTQEVFAVSGNLDEVMLTIGHELGHVNSPSLPDSHSEEAKAFSFEMAWAQAIFLHDIAGLRNSINRAAVELKPAGNGLHDLAFAYVQAATVLGKSPFELHQQLSNKETSFDSNVSVTNQHSIPVTYEPLRSSKNRVSYLGYKNKSNIQNVLFIQNFSWTDLGTGIYGMYIPLTASIFMNDRLLRTDLEQFHKTLGHEYVLHHVMQLPDGYIAKIMEETIFWNKDKENECPQ